MIFGANAMLFVSICRVHSVQCLHFAMWQSAESTLCRLPNVQIAEQVVRRVACSSRVHRTWSARRKIRGSECAAVTVCSVQSVQHGWYVCSAQCAVCIVQSPLPHQLGPKLGLDQGGWSRVKTPTCSDQVRVRARPYVSSRMVCTLYLQETIECTQIHDGHALGDQQKAG